MSDQDRPGVRRETRSPPPPPAARPEPEPAPDPAPERIAIPLDAPRTLRQEAPGAGRIADDLEALPPAPPGSGGIGGIAAILALALGGILLFDLYGWVASWLATGPVEGAIAGGLALLLVLALALVVWREWRSLAALGARDAGIPADPRAVAELLAPAPDAARQVALFRDLARGVNDPDRERALFEEVVLAPRDQAAEDAIARARGTVAGSVFVVPAGLLESLVFAALGLGLIRRVARIYGLRPGLLATMSLARRTLAEAAAIGALDVAAQGAARAFGALPAAADAALAALAQDRMRRIGRAAIRLCRPWPSR